MRHLWIAPLILLMFAAAALAEPTTMPAFLNSNSPTNRLIEQVNLSVQRGEQYLLSHQSDSGAWTEGLDAEVDAGRTALVGLALLSCGESHENPAIAKAIVFLKHSKIPESRATYCYALRAAFYSQLPQVLRDQELKQDVAWLEGSLIRKGNNMGLYTYNRDLDFVGGDFSNSQYGVLGVWYAALAGVEVPNSYWKQVEAAWEAGQNSDGGFGYTPGDKPSYASMTAAGAATLYITNDYLHANKEQNLGEKHSNEPLDAAIKWLGNNFAADRNAGRDPAPAENGDVLSGAFNTAVPHVGTYVHYMLYGFERVGEASGYTHFGSRNWFEDGAKYLAATQEEDGSWEGSDGKTVDTAYALLFLSRGRSPVALQKLQFDGRWNNRSRDCATIAHWLTQETERHINWQIIPSNASPAEFRQSPVLYIASDRPLPLSDPERQSIKTYIDQGGCVLAVNEGGADGFAKSIVELGKQLYPQYQFRDLPADHLIYTENMAVKNLPSHPQGLSNGIRELMILMPNGDLSWKFQQGAGSTKPELAPAFAFLANLYVYLNDKSNPRFKGQDNWISPDLTITPSHQLQLARLKINANWDPEPAGWERMSAIVRNADQLDLHITQIDAARLINLFSIAHLTSTDDFILTAQQMDALKHYLDSGGLLLFDAARGSEAAQLAFENVMQQMYPNAKLDNLPADHPIYTGKGFGGADARQVTYRSFAYQRIGRTNAPRLRALELNHHIAVIDSSEDLSAGLVGYNIDGIDGYSPNSAATLVRNILLWRESRLGK